LEEDSRTAVEGLELCWIDLGHLEDGNSHADYDKRHDNSQDLTGRGFQALEEHLGGHHDIGDLRGRRSIPTTVVTIEQKETVAREKRIR